MPYLVGTLVIALILISTAVKTLFPTGIRGFVSDTLIKFYPASIEALLHERRLALWIKTSQSIHDQRIWAYADRHSIQPGERFNLMMSAGPKLGRTSGYIEVFRIGFYGHTDRKKIWKSDRLEVEEYGLNNTAAAIGPAWPVAVTIGGTSQWRSGYYSIDFIESDGPRHQDVAFIVVTASNRQVDVLVKLATATYQAYNRWGGHNLYLFETPDTMKGHPLGVFESDVTVNRGDMVTFDRPTSSEFWEWEYHFVLWLEELAAQEGFSIGYATNFDLTRDPQLASECALFVSVGHDEYWSKEEFDQTHDRIFRQGRNTLFLGANTAYWQVRYGDVNCPHGNEGRQLICFKSMSDPIRYRLNANPELHVTARFRDNARRPETMLMGVAYQSNLAYRHQDNPRYAYYAVNTDLPFFDGTGYQPGDYVADIIGHEWDNRDPEAEYACPGEARTPADKRLWSRERSHIDLVPAKRIKTVFAGDVLDLNDRKGHAEAVYFESEAGAKVFSSGTNRWTWGLSKVGYAQEGFRRFNRNLLLDFLKGRDRSDMTERIEATAYGPEHANQSA